MDETTKAIKEDCRKLLSLLDDPHPGLVTWRMFLIETAKRLRDSLNKKLEG